MGTETLPDNTTVAAGLIVLSADFLTTNAALQGAFVGRNTSGVPSSGQSLGTTLYPWGNANLTALTIGGSVVDLSGIVSPANRIVSGKTRTTSGQPLFIDPNGSTNSFELQAAATNLVLSIDSASVTVSTDIDETGLTVAPGSNNTCTINDPSFNDQYDSKYYGEVDSNQTTITIDAAGSEITSRVGQMIALKTASNEIMWGWLKSTTELVSIKRGYFLDSAGSPIVRETLSDNDVLTLMETGWIFAENDGVTLDVTYLTPIDSFTSPTPGTLSQYWYDRTNQTWKRDNGAAFVVINRVPVGLCVIDTANCIAARAFDFYQDFQTDNTIDLEIFSDEVVRTKTVDNWINVYGTRVQIPFSQITWDNTTDMETGAVAKDVLYYLYISTDGERFISTERPYNRLGDLRGKYHPYNNWRYIGSAMTDSTSDWLQIASVESKEDIQLLTTDEKDRDALSRMVHALKINSSDSLQTIILGKKTTTDQLLSDAGIDTGNSSNTFFEAGNKKVVNDGVGGAYVSLWSGDDTTPRNITGVGFQPDMVWIFSRNVSRKRLLFTVTRGAGKWVEFQDLDAESTATERLDAFISDGITLGDDADVNTAAAGSTYVAWHFEVPTQQTPSTAGSLTPDDEYTSENGLSIIEYTGVTGIQTVGHNLTVNSSPAVPDAWIQKKYGQVDNWNIYHKDMAVLPETVYMELSTQIAATVQTNRWNDTPPTNALFTLGTSGGVNTNAIVHQIILIAETPGFSKVTKWNSNDSAVITGWGFQPEMVMLFNKDDVSDHYMIDNTRGATHYSIINDTSVEDSGGLSILASIDPDGITMGSTLTALVNKDILIIAFGTKGVAADIDFITNSQTTTENPIEVFLSTIFEEPDSDVTLNTDLKCFISRKSGAESQTTSATDGDGKPYWVQVKLEKAFDVNTSLEKLRAIGDLSGQGSGTALRVRFVGANTKRTYFEGIDTDYRGNNDE